jgi:predicted Zn-dependent peptidase
VAEGFRRRDDDKTLKLRVPQPASAAQKVEPTRERQTAICVGFGGPRAENSTYAPFELIEAAMNGAGGRLSNELIDKQGLASSVRLESESLLVAGAVYALVVTVPENEQRARAAVLSEMERFARAGLSAEEIESARALAAMMKIASLQSQPVRAVEYARAVYYGRDASSVDSFAEQLSKVTAEEIKRIASTYFKPAAASVGIIRAPSPQPRQNGQD